MNSLFYKLKSAVTRGGRKKSMLLSIVILAEVIALLVVATYAWVETVSSIKITNEGNTKGIVDTYVFTEAEIGGGTGTIDIAKYFKQSGDMHLAPASSADGRTMYFPKANISSNFIYRKGTVSDKNTAYLSVSFKLRADTNADFFFDQVPTFSALGDYIRVSVTSQSEGSTAAPVTTIYSNNASTTAVVNSTSGATGATTVEKYADHTKGKSSTARLFAVGANETKIVTINIWLQKRTDSNTDLTNNMSQAVTITNFGITSSLTPRHVTLIPTSTWENYGQYYYAWCWDAPNSAPSKLYKLSLDENEHYSFDYNGTYRKTLFFRSANGNLDTDAMNANNNAAWNNGTVAKQTEDTSIPNDPVDPTYIILTDNSGANNKSTGDWNDPAKINIAHITNQTDSWGTLSATSYTDTTSTHKMEETNSSSQKHKNTVHAWTGKKIKLVATAASANYAFEGWYNNEAGTGTALSTSATFTTDAPSTATEITYYAKFKEVRTLTIYRTVDGSTTSTVAAGTITINGSTSANTATSKAVTVDKGSSVTFSATAATGYTFDGFYTTATGDSAVTSPVTLNDNTTYYARFTTNSYNVTANAYYSNNGGTSYTAGNTGGTVTAGSSNAGATSTASVKYKSTVNLVASPADGYEFVGWYSAASGGTQLSNSATYTYTLNSAAAQNVYARFIKVTWEIGHGTSGGNDWTYNTMTVSGNNVTGSLTLTEGQAFSFKIRKTVGSTSTYYGANNASYSNITSTSFISNLALSSSGGDIYMKGHAGTYTFTFNKSTSKLSVTASYSNITITLKDNSSNKWLDDGDAIFYLDCSGYSGILMTKGTNQWTASIPSNTRVSGITFKRNDPDNTTTWNSWTWNRGYGTTYEAS